MNGIYRWCRSPAPANRLRKAAFLDRDGVLIDDPGFLCTPDAVLYLDEAIDAVARMNSAGVLVIVITNQSGIGRGLYGWHDFEAVQFAISEALSKAGAWLDGVWACPFYPEHTFRKPQPGMLIDAAERLGVDLGLSMMAGDRLSDVEAGLKAGVGMSYLVRTGRGAEFEGEVAALNDSGSPVRIVENLSEAVRDFFDV